MLLLPLISTLLAAGLANAQCNPMSAKCPAIPGLATKEYAIDFTKETKQPSNWTLADQAVVKYGPDGADFTFAKRFDAPYIWTSFYFLFGKVEITMKAAKGQGIVTGAVLMSDCLDEVDWEWSGSNFGGPAGKVQTNVFGKGITGNYDRGTQPSVKNPTEEFHTYVLDWTPDQLTWSIDGVVVRIEKNNKQNTSNYQYPQTPARLHLGIWNGGDQDSAEGVVQWVGGRTDVSKAPYTALFKSVKITNSNPCSSWEYPAGFKGTYQECKCTNQTISAPSPASSAAPKPTNLPCTYTIIENDYGYGIADKLHVQFADLNTANSPIDWDKLLLGHTLKVPGGNCSNSTVPGNSTAVSTQTPLYANTTISSAAASTGTPCLYNVADGDNGYSIAEKLHVSFSDFNDANPVDWDKLLVGWPLKVPGSKCFSSDNSTSTAVPPYANATTSAPLYANTTNASPTSTGPTDGKYIVCEGDYGYKIAEKLGCTFEDLNKANPGCDWDKLMIDQEVNVCKNTPADNINVVKPGQSTPKPVTPTQNGTALSTVTFKPSNPTASDINEICVIKTTTLCHATPVANMNRTTSTSIYTNGSIAVIPTTISTPKLCEYTVVHGDYGYKIAEYLGTPFEDLNKANPNQDWDKLMIGQTLKVPEERCSPKTTSTATATSTQTHIVVVGKNGTTTAPPQTSLSGSSPATDSPPVATAATSSPGTSAPPTTVPVCNRDNCYNNMLDSRYSASVAPFCSSYMAASNSGFMAVPIPAYLGGCQSKTERVTSACKCIMTPPSSTSTSSTSSGLTSGSSRGSLTSTGSSSTTQGTVSTTVVKSKPVTTIVTSSGGSSPVTLGTTAGTGSSLGTLGTTATSGSTESTSTGTAPGTPPSTLGTTSSTFSSSTTSSGTTSSSSSSSSSSTTPGSSSGTLGTTSSTSRSSSTTSGSTSSTTPGTSSSSSGTLGTTSSTTSTTSSSSSTTSNPNTSPTTSTTSSSSSSTTSKPPSTPPTTGPPPPSTPPTTSRIPPSTPPTTTTSCTTGGGEWGDWNGNTNNKGSSGGMGADSGRGKGSGQGGSSGSQGGNHKREAEACQPSGNAGQGSGFGSGAGSDQGINAGNNAGTGSSGFFGKMGWEKKREAGPLDEPWIGAAKDIPDPASYTDTGPAPTGHPKGHGGFGKREAAPEPEAWNGQGGQGASGGMPAGGPGAMGGSGSGGQAGSGGMPAGGAGGMGGSEGNPRGGAGGKARPKKKREAAPPDGASGGSGGFGGAIFGDVVGSSAGAGFGSGGTNGGAGGMPGAGSQGSDGMPGAGGQPGSGGSGGIQGGRWKRSPQDAEADTPGGAQGRGWKREANPEPQGSGTVTATITRSNIVTATGKSGAAATAATGAAQMSGNANTLNMASGSAANAKPAATGLAGAGSGSNAGTGSTGAGSGAGSGRGSGSGSNKNVVEDETGGSAGGANGAGSGAGTGSSGGAGGDMGGGMGGNMPEGAAGDHGWGAWMGGW